MTHSKGYRLVNMLDIDGIVDGADVEITLNADIADVAAAASAIG